MAEMVKTRRACYRIKSGLSPAFNRQIQNGASAVSAIPIGAT